jgi:hypothetical protein
MTVPRHTTHWNDMEDPHRLINQCLGILGHWNGSEHPIKWKWGCLGMSDIRTVWSIHQIWCSGAWTYITVEDPHILMWWCVGMVNNWNGSLQWEQCWSNYTSEWCGGSTGVHAVVCEHIRAEELLYSGASIFHCSLSMSDIIMVQSIHGIWFRGVWTY